MKASHKSPEALDKNQLLSLAMVLQDIKDGLNHNTAANSVVSIEPYATNDYFWARDDCFHWSDDGGDYSYSNANLKDTRQTMLSYLQEAAIVTSIKQHTYFEQDSYGKQYEEIDSYNVTINRQLFPEYYANIVKMAQPYLEAFVNKRDGEENVTLPQETPSEVTVNVDRPANLSQSKQTHTVSLRLQQRTLRLYIDGNKESYPIIKFKTTSGNNFKACNALCKRKKRILSRDDLGLTAAKTTVKDMPKTMGITGLLQQHFLTFNTEHQTMFMNDNVKMDADEKENLVKYVKAHFLQ